MSIKYLIPHRKIRYHIDFHLVTQNDLKNIKKRAKLSGLLPD